MAPRLNKRLLTVAEKYDILQMIDNGVPEKKVAEKYGVARSTLFYIKSNREKITKFFEDNTAATNSSTKALGMAASRGKFDRLLRQWYIRCQKKNIKVTDKMLRAKAQEINTKVHKNVHFKASLRWTAKFKERYGFRKVDNNEDLEITNEEEAQNSKAQLKNLLQDKEYTLDNVYNADSSGLMWRAVPEKTLLFDKSQSKKSPYGEQVLTFFCANATGCHKLPVLVIGTIKNPSCFKCFNMGALTTIYKANKQPTMDSKLFNEWFDECFLKSVIERQQKNGSRKKTLLLLDDAVTHHESGIISTKDEFVKIMYLPYDAAPLIQPMDRGIISCFKRIYRNELLETLRPLPDAYTEEELIDNHYQLNMWDCCRMINDAWSNVKNPILKNAWDKLLEDESEQSSEESEIIKKDINKALQKLNELPGCGECDSIAVMNWFETDKKHNTDTQVDINDTLLDFINVAMDTETDKHTDENLEDILDDSSPQKS